MKQSLLFHSPVPINREPRTGSSLRPKAIYEAFLEEGVEVWLIDGDSKRRSQLWQRVLKELEEKKTFLGVYSELSTRPLGLCDPDLVPRRPFLDARMFQRMRDQGIPVAAFYRDIYWRYPFFKAELGFLKSWGSMLFFWLELWQIKHSVNHLFFPSLLMEGKLPLSMPQVTKSSLPPGCDIRESRFPRKETEQPLQLLYIGGIKRPVNDISSMLKVVGSCKHVSLTICCREAEWAQESQYRLPYNATVVHRWGDQTQKLYHQADIFLMYWNMSEYLSFAMPVKLFNAIGAGIPVIVNDGTEMSRLVKRNGFGWAVKDEKELKDLLEHLGKAPELLRPKVVNIMDKKHEHTWRARAKEVIVTLEKIKSLGSF